MPIMHANAKLAYANRSEETWMPNSGPRSTGDRTSTAVLNAGTLCRAISSGRMNTPIARSSVVTSV